MDRIKEMLDQLSELEAEQLTELQELIVSEFETVENEEPSSQTVDAMSSLADMLDAVRSESKQREAAQQELAQRAAEAANRVYGDKEDKDSSEGNEDEEKEMSSEAEAAMDSEEEKKDMDDSEDEEPMTEEKEEAAMDSAEEPTDSEEEEDDMEEKKEMSEASVDVEKAAELSTETAPEAEASAEVEEAVTAAAEDEVVETEETEEVASDDEPAEAEASVEEESAEEETEEVAAVEEESEAEAAVESEVEAATEVTETSEASTQEENQSTELSVEETHENMEAPVTAAADNAENFEIEVPEDRRLASKESTAPVAITAGADIPGYTAGATLDTMDNVAEAMAKRLHALRRVNGGDGEQHIVASVTTSFPEERTLTTDSEENAQKIAAVISPEAITAAGGHVAPFEARYDVFGMGTSARPVRDSLPRFQADRGGIRFVTAPALVDHADAVGIWTAANDAAETPSPSAKQSLTVAAAAENTVATDAVTLQMQFGNLATRAYPELIARHNELGLIQHAREAEANILSGIAAGSTAVTSTNLIGVGRDALVQVGRAAAAYRSRHRLEADAPLRVVMPAWVKDAMAADLALSMPGDNVLNAYAEIDGFFASRGVNITYTLDGDVFGTQSEGAMTEFKDTFVWYIFAEGTFLFLDGGTLDLGIIRDSSLVGTNDYKMFVETFEAVAKVGVESLAVTSTIQVNGAAAALRDTLGGVASSTIEL